MIGPVNHLHVEDLAVAMKELGFDVVVAGNTEALLPPTTLHEHGIVVHDAPPAAHDTPAGILANVRWIRRLVRDDQPDIVHAHWLCGFAAFAALARAKPLVSMAWGSDVLRANAVKNLANRIALHGSERAVADSQELLDRMVALGAPRERVALITHGVDLERFAPTDEPREAVRARLGLGPGRVVLGPRTLLPLYNPETIVEAFALVADEFPDARLVLLSLFTSEFGLADRIDPARVHLAGRIDHDAMADYFRAADVCVSIPSSDGSPRTVWEAMACGCPAIVSDLPWAKDMIVAGRDALIVPIEAESVAAAIRLTLREPDVAERLRINGRALAVASQGKDTAMRNLADLYLSVLGRPT